MRIIFLDVDGVLNNSKTTDRVFGWRGIDPELVKNLKKLYDESNKDEETKIVVSSSWKRDEVRALRDAELGYEKRDNIYTILLQRLTDAGMEVLGYTTETKSTWERGEGILKWIKEYNESHEEPISNYVVLDDETFDFDMHEDLYKRFVHTAEHFSEADEKRRTWEYHVGIGLTDEFVNKALEILRTDFGGLGDGV